MVRSLLIFSSDLADLFSDSSVDPGFTRVCFIGIFLLYVPPYGDESYTQVDIFGDCGIPKPDHLKCAEDIR